MVWPGFKDRRAAVVHCTEHCALCRPERKGHEAAGRSLLSGRKIIKQVCQNSPLQISKGKSFSIFGFFQTCLLKNCITIFFGGKRVPPMAGTWSETKLIYHSGFFLKLAHDNVYVNNPKDHNRELRGF